MSSSLSNRYIQQSNRQDVNIKEILKTISNYKVSIISITIFSIILGSIYLYFQPSIYSSYTIVKVKTKDGIKNIKSSILNPISGPITSNIKEDIALIKTFYINDKALKLNQVNYRVQYYIDKNHKSKEIYKLIPIRVTDINITDKRFLGESLIVTQKDNGYTLKIKYSLIERLKAKIFSQTLAKIDSSRVFEYNKQITTPYFKFRVTKLSNSKTPIEIKINSENRYIYESIIKNNLKVTQLEDDVSLIKISYRDNIKERGLLYINSLTKALITESIKNKNEQNDKVLNFIVQELNKMKNRLSLSEATLERYRIRNEVIKPSVQASTFITELANIDIKLSENRLKRKIVKNISDTIRDSYNIDAISPLLMALNDKPTLNLISTMQDAQLKRDSLLSELTYKHPDVKALQYKIDRAKEKIVSNIRNLKQEIVERDKNLNRLKSRYERKIRGLPTKERKLVNIKRDYEVSSKLYNFLLQKKAENEMVRVATLSDYKVIDKPYSKLTPDSPKYKLVIVGFTILGLITGIISAFIRNAFYDKIRDIAEITSETTIPIVGVVPSIKKDEKRVKVYDNLDSNFTESYRNLRTTLKLSTEDSNRVILVTSTTEDEGANIVASNLGAIFEMANYKTIIVDFNIRDSSLEKIFKIDNIDSGVGSYLLGQNSLEDIIYSPKEYNNLDIIPVGNVSINPSELILSNYLPILIDKLRDRYEYIIINSTPFGFIQDTKYIMKFSDTNLVVFRANHSKKSYISDLNRVIKKDKIDNINIVFVTT